MLVYIQQNKTVTGMVRSICHIPSTHTLLLGLKASFANEVISLSPSLPLPINTLNSPIYKKELSK